MVAGQASQAGRSRWRRWAVAGAVVAVAAPEPLLAVGGRAAGPAVVALVDQGVVAALAADLVVAAAAGDGVRATGDGHADEVVIVQPEPLRFEGTRHVHFGQVATC